jgi:hypothetical protein
MKLAAERALEVGELDDVELAWHPEGGDLGRNRRRRLDLGPHAR